jgi:peptidoglycan/xylan/chitin deacetylase (PgdA/CDA1 family)
MKFPIFIIFFILITSLIYVTPINALIPNSCNCVIFQFNQVQDYYLNRPQTAVMDKFIEKHENLTLGVIGNFIGNDHKVTGKISEGRQKGNFEIAIQGWNYESYSTKSKDIQNTAFELSKTKIQTLFEADPVIFIPPYNAYDTTTLQSMKNLDMKIISSEFDKEDMFVTPHIYKDDGTDYKDTYGIYHLPPKAEYYDVIVSYDKNGNPLGKPIKTPLSTILSNVATSIDKYGYVVVTLHPTDFAEYSGLTPTNVVNSTEISDLDALITNIHSAGFSIKSFSAATHLPNQPLMDPTPSIIKNLKNGFQLMYCFIFHC